LRGREFTLVTYRRNWGEHRVYFFDEQGLLRGLRADWTDVFPADPFVVVSAGRATFRFQDLRELSWLLGGMKKEEAP
jgi:hypothetical protein